MAKKPINEQVIVITGASSGIGLATALMAAERGARVVLSSRNKSDLDEIVRKIKKSGRNAIAVQADVTSLSDLKKLRDQAIQAFGRIDTWVNNAGTSIYGSLLDTPVETERQLFETNFWGIRLGSQVAVEALKEKGGVLINLGSEVSGRAIPVQGMYSATKHAVKAFTDALRMELEREDYPISVVLVRPTAINTPFANHGTNLLKEGEPSLPAPSYHPNVAAEAILKAAVHPQRDVYVGGGSRLSEVMDTFLPRLMDRFLERMMWNQQTEGTTIPHRSEQEALLHAPAKEGEVVGASKHRMRETSAYTFLSQRPLGRLALVGAAALLVGTIVYESRKAA